MTYQNYRLCHGCRKTYTNQGHEINGIFYCDSCASIRRNSNRQVTVRQVENTPNRTASVYQNSYSPRITATSSRRGHPFITATAVILIILIIYVIHPKNKKQNFLENQKTIQTLSKTQEKSQPNIKQQTSSQTKNQASLKITNNENFTIQKYVHTTGLNARSGPDIGYQSLFIIPQNSIVYLSSTNKSGVWRKIKYNGKTGWVNETFLRDFTITSLEIGNHDDDGHWLTRPGNNVLYASMIEHLGLELKIETMNNYSKVTKLYLKIISPENKFIQGNRTLSGFSEEWDFKIQSGIYNRGTFSIPAYYYKYRPGTWLIKLYYQNPDNDYTLDCIASKYFALH